MEGAQGSRLFVRRDNDTNNHTAFTASLPTEITRLVVCNNTGSAVTFRFFHVPSGGAAGIDNALWYDKSVAARDTFLFGGDTGNGGIHLEEGEFIVVQQATGNALTFHAYGLTASIAPGVQANG